MAIVAGLLLAVAPLAMAQTRALEGTVTSGGEPARRAVVKLEDDRTLLVRSYVTQNDGHYHFAGLSMDSDYHVWAERNGHTSDKRSLSRFNSEKDKTIDLELK